MDEHVMPFEGNGGQEFLALINAEVDKVGPESSTPPIPPDKQQSLPVPPLSYFHWFSGAKVQCPYAAFLRNMKKVAIFHMIGDFALKKLLISRNLIKLTPIYKKVLT